MNEQLTDVYGRCNTCGMQLFTLATHNCFGVSPIEPMIKLQVELQQTREELELAKRKHDNLFISASFIKGEFEQVKAELDKLREEAKTPLQRGMDAIRIIGEFNNEVKP